MHNAPLGCEVCGWGIMPGSLDYMGTSIQGAESHGYHQSCLEGIALTSTDLRGSPNHIIDAVGQVVVREQWFKDWTVSQISAVLALSIIQPAPTQVPLNALKALFAYRRPDSQIFNLERLFDFTTELAPVTHTQTRPSNYRDLMEQLGATVQLAEVCRSVDERISQDGGSTDVVSIRMVIESQLTGPQPSPRPRPRITFN